MIKKIIKNKTILLVIALTILSFILHLVYLSWPDWQIFDEIYYYNWAGDYLNNVYFFDVHPPLGKLIISLGLSIFNHSLFGARFFQALAGSALVYFMYYLADILFKNKVAAVLSAVFLFLETSIYVESRFALLNIFIVFFIVVSFITFWKYREEGETKYFYYSLFFVSLAASVKWTGVSALLVYIIFTIFDKKMRKLFFSNFQKNSLEIMKFVLGSFFALVLPYITIFVIDIVKGEDFKNWHIEAYNFHKNLKSNHPYASHWYQWFLDYRPIWLEFKQTPSGDVVGINQVGNPIILWLGTFSLFFSAVWAYIYKKSSLFIILLMIIVNTVPWVFIKREAFYYHFIPMIPFVILSLSYMLSIFYKKFKVRFIVFAIVILSMAFYIWYWPLLNGIQIPYNSYNERVIFPSWR